MSSSATNRDVRRVVYVHGLWLRGYEAALLRRRLGQALDADTCAFTYASVGASITDNAIALRHYLAKISADRLHLVAHSLGGLVVLKLFELQRAASDRTGAQPLPPGRVVFLGSPVQGSQTAKRLVRLPLGRALLGATAGEALLAPQARRWDGARELGIIAGDLAFGAGRLLGPMGAPNDGTVLVSETHLPGATEHLRLRVSHSGLPYSTAVAVQVASFLRDGCFQPAPR